MILLQILCCTSWCKTLLGREGQTATTGLTIRKPLPVNPVHAFAEDCTVHANPIMFWFPRYSFWLVKNHVWKVISRWIFFIFNEVYLSFMIFWLLCFSKNKNSCVDIIISTSIWRNWHAKFELYPFIYISILNIVE